MTFVEFLDKHFSAIGTGLGVLAGGLFVLVLFCGWPWRRG